MADSDDEYDRKRRDKFRGERTESYPREGRRGGGDDRRREDWLERDSWGSRNRPRTDYRDYRGGGGGRERYSPARAPDISPPMKRVRSEWDDRRTSGYSHDGSGSGYGNYGSSWGHDNYNSQHAYGNSGNSQSNREMQNVDTQPPMMSFKAFLQTQDDNITDDEAIKKYNEYKLEFKRQQLNEFFVTHKEEEWFKIKYHPEDSVKRKEEQMNALKNRVNVFLEFLDCGRLDKVSVDADQSEQLIRLLDAVVIRLEGGTEHDLLVLDEPKVPPLSSQGEKSSGNVEKPSTEFSSEVVKEEESKSFAKDSEVKDENEQGDDQQLGNEESQPMQLTITSEQAELQRKAKEFSKQKSGDEEKSPSPEDLAVLGSGNTRKRKREYEYDSGSDSGDEPPPPGETIEMEEDEPPPPGLEEHKEEDSEAEDDKKKEQPEEEEDVKDEESEANKKLEDEGDAGDSIHSVGDKDENPDQQKTEVKDISADNTKDETVEIEVDQAEDKTQKVEDSNKPRPLHRTASIFLRNLAPTITKQEVEAMCKRYPGFLRVAIADPQPERRWFRRGWVTFERQVNIKEICWNLNNIRLRDCELGAIVNRDLSRRIRTVNGITSHRQVVRHDIKLSARIVHNLDSKCGLWIDEDAKDGKAAEAELEKMKNTKDQESIPSFGLLSKNPVLKNITDYLIEEASAEEEELLGHSTETEDGGPSEEVATVDRDEGLIKVLDKLLFYLRVVHSVDYYNHCEYPNEDEMPNRCGIMHARGIPPSSKVTPQELSDYCRTFEQKIASFLQPITKVSDDEFLKLGSKDPDVEVEKFIQANTQELAKDKWLCPLSGKKFKGPEFVRKHIFNKHTEKVDEVKKEVEYFNNYLRDPKRPQLAEHPGNRQQRKEAVGEARDGFPAPAPYVPHYQYNYGSSRHGSYGGHSFAGGYSYNQSYNQSYSRPSRGGYNRGRGSSDYRPVIHYRDLDAPREPEEFI